MIIFEKIGSKYTPKRTILNNFLGGGGGMPPNPTSKAHGEVASRHANFQICKPEKKTSCPPLSNPGYAPVGSSNTYSMSFQELFTKVLKSFPILFRNKLILILIKNGSMRLSSKIFNTFFQWFQVLS